VPNSVGQLTKDNTAGLFHECGIPHRLYTKKIRQRVSGNNTIFDCKRENWCYAHSLSISFWWWTRISRVHVTKTPKLANLDSILCFFVTRTRITSSTRHLESVLALTRHLIRLLAVRINSRVGDKNTLSWCLCSIKIEHAYTSHPLDTLVSDCNSAHNSVRGWWKCMRIRILIRIPTKNKD
jgi:hypothetical protein